LPFFVPLYQKANQFHFHSFNLPRASLEEALQGQMTDPYFPVNMTAMLAQRSFSEVNSRPINIDDFTEDQSPARVPLLSHSEPRQGSGVRHGQRTRRN
jgi:hypothetical protein